MGKLIIRDRFGQVPVELLNDPNISFKAKGLFAFMQAKPDGWSFSVARIAAQAKEGREAVAAGLKELEDKGYLVRTPSHNSEGVFDGYDYELRITPLSETRNTGNPSTVNPQTEKPYTISKIDSSKKELNKYKYSSNEEYRALPCEEEKSYKNLKPEDSQKEKVEYGNKDVNEMLRSLKSRVGVDAFADSSDERNFGRHLVNLKNQLGETEFNSRLDAILLDAFKFKNCNRIKFVYREIKAFIKPKNPVAPVAATPEEIQERMKKFLTSKQND